MSTDPSFNTDKLPENGCVVLIGMASAGKSTVGKQLAERLSWAFMDTDHVIEAHYGTRLQNVADSMTKEEFLDMECDTIGRVNVKRCIIATGGSVVYRQAAIDHLKTLGPLVYLDVSLPLILERLAQKPDRGLAIAPGQTFEDLFNERQELYSGAATFTLKADDLDPEGCVDAIIEWLKA